MKKRLCGYCIYMRPDNGKCKLHVKDVNFFDERPCFCNEKEEFEPLPETRKVRVAPKQKNGWSAPRRAYAENRRTELAKRTEKVCAICHRLLPLDEFISCSRIPDGHGSYCKECYARKKREKRKAKAASNANSFYGKGGEKRPAPELPTKNTQP